MTGERIPELERVGQTSRYSVGGNQKGKRGKDMKTFKKVLASALAAAMVVTAFPVTNAEAASTAKLNKTKATVYAGQSTTLKVTTPKTWKSVKVTASKKGAAAKITKVSGKKVTVKAVKAGTAKVTVKVTAKVQTKKGKKVVTKKVNKTLKATITVKTPSVKLAGADVLAVGNTTALTAKTAPKTAKVTYKTSNKDIATVDSKGVVTGVADGNVTITASIKTGTKTTKATKKITVYAPLDIASATPSSSGSNIVVTFTTPVKSVDYKDFYLGGDVLVETAVLSEDGKTATLTLNKKLTSTVEYTLDALKLTPVNGAAKEKLSTKLTWVYTDGASITTDSLAKIGETTGIRVIDAKGQEVSVVKSLQVITSNSAIVALDGTAANITAAVSGTLTNVADIKLKAASAGTATVTVKAVLVDGTTLTEAFAFTVADATIATVGYTLYDPSNARNTIPATAPANAKAAASVANTTLRWASATTAPSAKVAYFKNTNGDPDIEKIALTTSTVKAVESLNKTVATASVDASDLTVTASANVDATANFRVTMMDGTYWTFSVDVQKAPELSKIVLDKTTLKLSDEAAAALGTKAASGVAGVDTDTVKATFKDQYDADYTIPADFDGKVVVSTNSVAGIEISAASGTVDADKSSIEFSGAAIQGKNNVTYTVTAKKDQTANPTIAVKYFENARATTAKISVTTNVSVVNIDGNATVSAVKGFTGVDDATICANACTGCVNSIDYAAGTYFLLDAAGNKLAKVDSTKVVAVNKNTPAATAWVTVATNKVAFAAGAKDYYSGTSTTEVLVKVPVDGATAIADDNFLSKVVKVTAINHRSVPHAAKVTNSNVTIKNCGEVLTIDQLLFGVIDDTQMIIDDTTVTGNTIGIGTAADGYIAVKGTAKNGGYKYNKPVISITNDQNKEIDLGAMIYGLSKAETDGSKTWAITGAGAADTNGTIGVTTKVVSISGNAAGKVDQTGLKTALTAGETVSFTVLINTVTTANDDDSHKDANLLSGVQSVTFTISK